MKYLLLFLTVVCSSAFAAENQTTICKNEGQERKIEIAYIDGTEVPCEVQYTKYNGMQVLWSAQGETGYCEQKAAAFVEKQRAWGWQCDAVEQTEQVEQVEKAEPVEQAEPVEKVEQTEQAKPVEQAEQVKQVEQTEPQKAMDQ